MDFEDLVSFGIAAMFGSLLPGGLVGMLVARRLGGPAGIAVAAIVFGLVGLGFAGLLFAQLAAPELAALPPHEARDRQMLVGVFVAFGGFALLLGAFLLARRHEDRRAAPTAAPPPLPPWRRRAAQALTVAGNLVLVGTFVTMMFFEERLGGVERGTVVAFRAVALAALCWVLALAFGRRLSLSTLLFFVILGGGFWLAAQSLVLMSS